MTLLPALKDITLEQWVAFYQHYGRELDRRYAAIQAMPEGQERADMYMLYSVDAAQQTMFFYRNHWSEDVKSLLYTTAKDFANWNDEVLLAMSQIANTISWDNAEWQLQPVTDTDSTSFSKFELLQQLAEALADIDEGDLELIYGVIARLFRKVGESGESIDMETRAEQIKKLPLDIAYAVIETIRGYVNTGERSAVGISPAE